MLKYKDLYFLALYIYIKVYIWIKVICDFGSEKYHYQYSESQKWQSGVNCEKWKKQWSKSELDSRYLQYECNIRIGDLFVSSSILQKEHGCVFDKPKVWSFSFK